MPKEGIAMTTNQISSIAEHVAYCRSLGMQVFPVKFGCKFPSTADDPKIRWKEDYISQGKEYENFPEDHGLGFATGKASNNIIVIDIDNFELFKKLAGKSYKSILNKTRVDRTGRGVHLIVRGKNVKARKIPIPNSKHRIEILVDQFCVLPPTLHENGTRYRTISTTKNIANSDVDGFVNEIYRLMGADPDAKPEYTGYDMDQPDFQVTQGGRHNACLKYFNFIILREDGKAIIDRLEFERKAREFDSNKCVPPQEKRDVDQLVNDCWNFSMRELETRAGRKPVYVDKEWSTVHMCELLKYRFHPISLKGIIYTYEGGLFLKTGEELLRKEIQKYFYGAPVGKKNEIISTLIDENSVQPDELNCYHDLLNVKNCMLNVQTLQVFPHNPKYLSTHQFPVNYDPQAVPMRMIKFLGEMIPNPHDLKSVLEMFCIILIPFVKIEKALVAVGDLNNGKSTILKVLKALIGPQNISASTLQQITSRFGTYPLLDKVANIGADIPSVTVKQNDILKGIISQDPQGVEQKGIDVFMAILYIRMFFSANDLPELQNETNAFFKRFIVIPFPVTIPDDEIDVDLLDKLSIPEELSGFLNILLRILRGFARNKYRFSHPQSVRETKDRWHDRSPSIISKYAKKFMESTSKKSDFVGIKKAFDHFRGWCFVEGHIPPNQLVFRRGVTTYLPMVEYEKSTSRDSRIYGFHYCKLNIPELSEPADQTKLT